MTNLKTVLIRFLKSKNMLALLQFLILNSVLDTKFMASSDDFKDLIPITVLKNVFETVSKDPFEMPSVGKWFFLF